MDPCASQMRLRRPKTLGGGPPLERCEMTLPVIIKVSGSYLTAIYTARTFPEAIRGESTPRRKRQLWKGGNIILSQVVGGKEVKPQWEIGKKIGRKIWQNRMTEGE